MLSVPIEQKISIKKHTVKLWKGVLIYVCGSARAGLRRVTENDRVHIGNAQNRYDTCIYGHEASLKVQKYGHGSDEHTNYPTVTYFFKSNYDMPRNIRRISRTRQKKATLVQTRTFPG